MKIAVNKCYGGFSLSRKAGERLKEIGVKLTLEGEYYPDGSGPCKYFMGYHIDNEDFGIESDNYLAHRTDNRLIRVIEEFGEKEASGELSEIRIIEVPDDIEWHIDEYDGIETVHENHRSW